MRLWEGWVRHGPLALHFLTGVPSLAEGHGTPLLIVPALAEAAEDYADLLQALAPRPCFALSLRGRGQSSAPTHGYTLADHVSDLEAFVAALEPPPFCLLGCGHGVVYALAYAARWPDRLAGLIVGDHPASQPALPPGWVEDFLGSTWRNLPVSERMMCHVVEGLQREAEEVSLWEALPGITCPALILYGGQPGAGLALPEVERYLQLLPDARVWRLPESGGCLWEPDYAQAVLAIGAFLHRLDEAGRS
ncbi:MAG: alpha/beta fold hydrolase [Anaerolineae bacterium]|nr:alpha/beta fold hydrolase [Anaerolineae bacterium]